MGDTNPSDLTFYSTPFAGDAHPSHACRQYTEHGRRSRHRKTLCKYVAISQCEIINQSIYGESFQRCHMTRHIGVEEKMTTQLTIDYIDARLGVRRAQTTVSKLPLHY